MNIMKKFVAVVLAVMLMVPSVVLSAAEVADSPSLTDISKASVSINSFDYNGKLTAPAYHIIYDGTVLKRNVDFKLSGLTHKNVGTYTVTFKGIGKFTGTTTATYRISKIKQSLAAKQVKSIAYKSVKAKNVTVKATKGLGTGSYKVVVLNAKNKKYVSVNPSTGSITIKKGAVKGTYRVKLTYAGDKNHEKATTTVAIVVK